MRPIIATSIMGSQASLPAWQILLQRHLHPGHADDIRMVA